MNPNYTYLGQLGLATIIIMPMSKLAFNFWKHVPGIESILDRLQFTNIRSDFDIQAE